MKNPRLLRQSASIPSPLTPLPAGEGNELRFASTVTEAYLGGSHKAVATKDAA